MSVQNPSAGGDAAAGMPVVLFTKLFGARPVTEVGGTIADLGFDGVDLLVRPGATVDPQEAGSIPAAVESLRAVGLSVPMVTTDLTDPGAFPADRVLGACSESGVRLVRLGYWKYAGPGSYHEALAAARRQLDALERLAGARGVRLAIQLHGGTIHASGALTAALLDGRDPARIGAYPDPGNQAVQDGREDWRMTLDLLAPWLACVGVKNGGWAPANTEESGQRRWRSDWLGLADGMVAWADILTHLATTGFGGPLTLHSHYELPYPQVLDQTRLDLRFARRILAAAAGKVAGGHA